MKLRILSVDFPIQHDLIANYRFVTAPAFSDFDAVIIDPSGVEKTLEAPPAQRTDSGGLITYMDRDGGHGRRLQDLITQRKGESHSLLAYTRGVIIVLARPGRVKLNTWGESGSYFAIGPYDWLPLIPEGRSVSRSIVGGVINLRPRAGSVVEKVARNHPLAQYFSAFRNEVHYSCVIEMRESPINTQVIATDKVGSAIAVDCEISGGKVLFVPSFLPGDSRKAGAVFANTIRNLLGMAVADDDVEWVSKYPLIGQDKWSSEIKALDSEIRVLEAKKRTFETEEQNLKSFQVLLYGQGKFALEPVVRNAFRLFGFDVPDPDDYSEPYDLLIRSREGCAIGEVEGVDRGAVDLEKYRQLLDYVDQELTGKGVECKGILVGNGYRLIDPKGRPDQFTEAARRGCMSRGFCMITTVELYRTVNEVLDNPDDKLKERIRKSILGTVGEWKLDML